MRKLKNYKVKLLVHWTDTNGNEVREEKTYSVPAMNTSVAFKKAVNCSRREYPQRICCDLLETALVSEKAQEVQNKT